MITFAIEEAGRVEIIWHFYIYANIGSSFVWLKLLIFVIETIESCGNEYDEVGDGNDRDEM